MSKFITKLPTEVQTLIDALLPGHYIHGITLNPETKYVMVIWEHDKFDSGLTVPVDFDLDDIKKKRLPSRVTNSNKKKVSAPTPTPTPIQAAAPIEQPSNAPVYLTEDEVNQASKDGKSIEYQGIEIGWKQFDPKIDFYREGFFYRIVEQKPVDAEVKPT